MNISCGRRHGLSRKSRMRLLLVEKDRCMQSLLKALTQKAVVLGLMLLIVFSSLNIFVAPSYAITASRYKLTSQDKIDRAYQYRECAGILEEEKQASTSAKQIFKPEDKANLKSVKASQATDSEKSLVEQGKDLLEKVTGK